MANNVLVSLGYAVEKRVQLSKNARAKAEQILQNATLREIAARGAFKAVKKALK